MTDFQAIMADFAVRQAERAAQAQSEIQRLKAAIIAPLRNAEIARVEIRFDGVATAVRSKNASSLTPWGRVFRVPK
ncbi:hypothetical protein [Novosphingobium decolorationis]|uniref:hypothetical protein n=1 Tax=Novosphingobium decolorationis TaxID=2698673 RepID=UPI001EF142A1|nr:hypothetical protein [Novosphingobium decolorationis]